VWCVAPGCGTRFDGRSSVGMRMELRLVLGLVGDVELGVGLRIERGLVVLGLWLVVFGRLLLVVLVRLLLV
jgi:hypothetical protein